ncbi:hypothetical protein Nhal_1662 [Nitrosococcus halophilus Nc 4]|uniref:Transporter n=1 Tax=Nitrosococcus halophilus (strain Nc4) TaxID=472759 RepID=D5C2D3_NITHN|nr:transporter [Nitrosococcus halophilus]ADE14792.1 hypothetical protein Nhal_1662 [Nitrosococcus halophilus Nc 4]
MDKAKLSLFSAALGGLSSLVPPVAAAPTTFNTALPVSQGEVLLRAQTQFLRASEDPGPLDRELEVLVFPLVGVYGLTPRLALFGIFPLLDKELEVNTPLGRQTREVSGLGDSTFLARYIVYWWDAPGETFRIAPFVGLEAPIGEDDERDALGRLPQPLQLGSGSWDPLAGGVLTWQTLEWEFDASVSYQANTEANEFEFGDVARLDMLYQRRVGSFHWQGGVPHFLYAGLESNLIWQDRSQIVGRNDPNSGGLTWFLAPGLQYITRRFVVEMAVQIPVVQDLNGQALETDFNVILSFRMNF